MSAPADDVWDEFSYSYRHGEYMVTGNHLRTSTSSEERLELCQVSGDQQTADTSRYSYNLPCRCHPRMKCTSHSEGLQTMTPDESTAGAETPQGVPPPKQRQPRGATGLFPPCLLQMFGVGAAM
eukprot:scaffold178325_cov20-Prasinocladus_malaysianus.AAC.2